MCGHKHILASAICLVLLLGASETCSGRVFWRRRARSPSEFLGHSGDWNRLLQSDVRINGGRGSLEILGCVCDLESATRLMKSARTAGGKPVECVQGEGMAFGVAGTETGVLRMIALEGMEPGRTMLFILSQSRAEYRKSVSPLEVHNLAEAPIYPGSTAQTFVYVEETRAKLEVSRAHASPEAVHAFFRSAMTANGWVLVAPGAARGAVSSGLSLFSRGNEVCGILVQPAEAARESVITVLHKRMRTK